jgi:hypothetical protein
MAIGPISFFHFLQAQARDYASSVRAAQETGSFGSFFSFFCF